jgi:hypothetical protein
MTLQFYRISFCVLYVQVGWALSSTIFGRSLCVWVEFLSKILGLIAARGIGFILQSNTDRQLSRWRGGVEERIIWWYDTECGRYFRESAQMGGWGEGLYIIFDLGLEAKIAVPAKATLTCSLPQTHFLHIILKPLLELLFWPPRRVQNWYITSAPPPPQRKGGSVYLPTHFLGKKNSAVMYWLLVLVSACVFGLTY